MPFIPCGIHVWAIGSGITVGVFTYKGRKDDVLACATMSLASLVAQNLRIVRTQRKLSQEALAAKAGISVSYVSMLERGQRTPPLDTLEAVAKALAVSPLYLLQRLPGRSKPD